MKNRKVSVVLAMMLLLQVMFGGAVMSAVAEGQTSVTDPTSITDSTYGNVTNSVYGHPASSVTTVGTASILNKVTLKAKGPDGVPVDVAQHPDTRFDAGQVYHLIYEWELPNGHAYDAGDQFAFQLPPQFAIHTPIDEPIVADDGEIGRFTVDLNGNVVMTFHEYVDTHSAVSGKLEIMTNLKQQVIAADDEVAIPFLINGSLQTIVVKFRSPVDSMLEVSGIQSHPSAVDWQINLNKNQKLENIRGVDLEITIPEGLRVNEQGFGIYRLQVNGDGSTRIDQEVEWDEYRVEQLTERTYKIGFFPDWEYRNRSYEVLFGTEIVEPRSEFTLRATLQGNHPVSAEATVTKHKSVLIKKKSSFNSRTGTVSWEILYNDGFERIPVAQARFEDRFTDNMRIVPNSIKLYEDYTDLHPLPPSQYTVTPATDGRGFTVQFANAIFLPRMIKYETRLIDRPLDDVTVSNTVYSQGQQLTHSLVIAKETLRVLTSQHSKLTNLYRDKKIVWSHKINGDLDPNGNHYVMDNVKIDFEFTNGGLKLVENSLSIVSEDGRTALVKGRDYRLLPATPGKQGFAIDFVKADGSSYVFNKPYVVGYVTAFNKNGVTGAGDPVNMPNKAKLKWTADGQIKEFERTDLFVPDDYTKNNGGISGTYDASSKIITWDVAVNYNLDEIQGAKVIHQILDGQTYVANSAAVYKAALTGWQNKDGVVAKELTRADEVELAEPWTGNGNTLTVAFNSKIKDVYLIRFQTSLEGTKIQSPVLHHAIFSNSTSPGPVTLTGNVTIDQAGKYLELAGKPNGNKVDWQATINHGQSHIGSARVIGAFSENQTVVGDTYHVYPVLVGADGSFVKDTANELVRGQDYDVLIESAGAGQRFILSFSNTISRPYIIEYQSAVTSTGIATANNEVSLQGDGSANPIASATQSYEVRTSNGSGSGGGTVATGETDQSESQRR